MMYQKLVDQVARELPFPSADGPQRAVEATLAALLESVPAHVARAVLADLPGVPAALRRAARGPGVSTLAALRARVAPRMGQPEPRAMEQAQVVCAVLERTLPSDDVAALQRSLPNELATLLERRQTAAPAHASTHGHTLADAAPGSAHPVSEAGPGSRHPVSAAQPAGSHEHSVAAPNPHGDTKLSSTHGMTQEREHESLSEGRSKRS